MDISKAQESQAYHIREIRTNDPSLEDFLFTLGCYTGETITLVSALSGQYVISVKDARYSINQELAESIIIG